MSAKRMCAAGRAAETLDQSGLRQQFQHLGDRGRFHPRALGQFGGAVHALGLLGEHREHHGGVVGELGDAEHRGGRSQGLAEGLAGARAARAESGPELYGLTPAHSIGGV